MAKRKSSRRKSTPWVAFVDEAGNTGTNYLDDDQPFFLLACWIFRESKVDGARAAIAELLKPQQTNQAERKASQLVQTRAGRLLLADVLSAVGTHGGFPFLL